MARYPLFLLLVAATATSGVVLSAQQTGVPPTPSGEQPQMIVLLIDLQIPTGERRLQAVTAAQTVVQRSWERWSVGLDRPHLFSVKTVGAGLDTIQDFTWNPDLAYTALRTAWQQPSPATTDLAIRTDSVAGMCRALAKVTPNPSQFAGLESISQLLIAPASTPKAVYFYSNFFDGNLNGAVETLATARAFMSACRPFNVLLLLGVVARFPLAPATPPPVGVSVRVVPHQAGSPVSIVESMSDLDDGYASVVLRDDAEKAIRSVTLGALALPLDPAMTTPQVFIRRGPNVTLLPRATVAIAAQLIDASTLTALARKGTNIEIGIVGVEFADGSTWTYDLAAKGRFER